MARAIPTLFSTRRDATLTSVAGEEAAQVQDEVTLWALTATVLATFAVIPLALIVPAVAAGLAASERFPPWLSIGALVSTPEKVWMPPTAPVFAPTVHV